MSVYIKGMEMPKSCESCPCKTADAFGGLVCQATGYIPLRKVNQDRPDACPLVPVPEHGRLIDADAIPWIEGRDEQDNPAYLLIKKCVDVLPTIIPAKEGE